MNFYHENACKYVIKAEALETTCFPSSEEAKAKDEYDNAILNPHLKLKGCDHDDEVIYK